MASRARTAQRRPAGTLVRDALHFADISLSRGTALFFGLYSLANALATWRSANPSEDIWWIDLSFLPQPGAVALGLACAVALAGFGVSPRMAPWRRWLTAGACVALGAVGLVNTAAFYRLWGAGAFTPGVPVPLSLLIAIAFGLLAWRAWVLRPVKRRGLPGHVGAIAAALVVLSAFPLAQIAFFGTSDYRAKADAAVVFGAKAYADGSLSTSLHDRMTRGIELYRRGLVNTLVVSGGVGASGVDETVAMRNAAEKAGVPRGDIILDHNGVDTDATVRNTVRAFRDEHVTSVLAVSQFYHLPRIKLAYRAAGFDVRTVPAATSLPIPETPLFVVREIPAFWLYWGRAFWRDVRGT